MLQDLALLIDAIIAIKFVINGANTEGDPVATDVTRTTLSLPTTLLEKVDEAVRSRKVSSRNAFVANAIRRALIAQEEAEIDADFALMATDDDYRAEVARISAEFATADWEAFQLGESAR
ncbi:MAG: CopG family transcriptional regulator [Thermomicrobiales bacterium]